MRRVCSTLHFTDPQFGKSGHFRPQKVGKSDKNLQKSLIINAYIDFWQSDRNLDLQNDKRGEPLRFAPSFFMSGI